MTATAQRRTTLESEVPEERVPRIASRPAGGHIAGLDGLRAIAIVAVLIYHLRPTSLPGGFLGVDVFFVLSGFLITTLLLRELTRHNRINLPQFWLRRARRLIPALLVVVLGSVSLAWLVGGDLLVNIGRQALGVVTFTNNWLEIGAGSSYFSRTSPLLFVNFWSLAIEEQFYLLWPIVLVLLVAFTASMRRRTRLVLGLAAASALLMAVLYTPGADATRVYYGTDTHLFGLMVGVALAFSWQTKDSWLHSRSWQRWRLLAALGALGVLVVLMRTLHDGSALTFRGGILLSSLATAVMLAALLGRGTPYDRLMEARPLRWVGERSYGIYLWHWPVILIITELLPATTYDSVLSWTGRGLALGLTLAVAAASYRWLEQPVRRLGFVGAGKALGAGLNGPRPVRARIAVFAAVGLVAATSVAIATAPSVSGTAQQLAANAALVEQAAAPAEDVDAAAPEQDWSVPTGAEISGFGDSIMVTSAHGLTDRWPEITMDARSNRQWPDAVTAVEGALASDGVRRAVVLDFGTNAGITEVLVRDVLEALGPSRMVVVVNLYAGSHWIPEANDALGTVVADYPNAVVADWYEAIDAQPEQLQSDRIHPDIAGGHLYTDVVAGAFVELAERHGGSTTPSDDGETHDEALGPDDDAAHGDAGSATDTGR